jgi:hypothetical protein
LSLSVYIEARWTINIRILSIVVIPTKDAAKLYKKLCAFVEERMNKLLCLSVQKTILFSKKFKILVLIKIFKLLGLQPSMIDNCRPVFFPYINRVQQQAPCRFLQLILFFKIKGILKYS